MLDIIKQQVEDLKLELADHTEAEMKRDIETAGKIEVLSDKIDAVSKNVHDLLNLWEQARGMVTLVKWSSAIIGFILSIFIFFKGK